MADDARAGAPAPAAPVVIGSPEWRARAAAAQDAAVPAGDVTVSCTAPLGVGGLGRHLEEIMGALQRVGASATCICEPAPGERPSPASVARRHPLRLLRPLGRISPAWRLWRVSVEFDAGAAARLPAGGHLIGFNGTSLAQLRAARAAGAESTSLVSATAHVDSLVAQHARAHRAYPLERPWATRVRPRNLREYELADRIYVSSRYVRESFVEHGIDEERLSAFPLTPSPRFTPAPERRAADAAAPSGGTFEVVYIGGLTVDKGVPLLIDAVRRLAHADLRLRLVGGWKTRGMRAFVQRAMAADQRISVRAGDPLDASREAHVRVHAAYSDGFSYAVAEALACGVPVIVSEDTGAKELVTSATGLVLPTGDLDALTQALDAAYRGELSGRASEPRSQKTS